MGELEGIDEDVPFHWDGAAALSAKLRIASGRLEGQISPTRSAARAARAAWRGAYAEQFDGRVDICASDAHGLAGAMNDAADMLDELARLAQEEQDRRIKARQWEEDQRNKSFLEKVTDEVGITSKNDDKPPPVDYGDGRRYTAPPHAPGVRE